MRQVIDQAFLETLESHDLRIKKPMKGLFGGNRRSKAYGSSAEFADYREYEPGDDLRRIDWNLYGRFEKLFLKLFVDERQLHHKIYIDASASMDWGEPDKAQVALKLAAALGYLSVKSMDRVTFYAIHQDKCVSVGGTVIGQEAYYAAADRLNRLDFYGSGDIGAAIGQQEDIGHGDGISIIISDFLTDCDWKSAVDQLLFHNRQVHLIQVLSPDELLPGMTGNVNLLDLEAEDPEDLRHYRTEITRSAMKAYGQALKFLQKDIRQFCGGRDVGYICVRSDESIEKMLFDQATEAEMIL